MSSSPSAPFIWTETQPIDPLGFLATIQAKPPRAELPNRWFLLRRLFALDVVPEHVPLNITVDGRYQLFINGQFIGRGPVRCDPLHQKYDTYDVASALRPGPNVIGVIVHALGVDTSWYETTKGMWQPTFGHGSLWVESAVVATDMAWQCLACTAWQQPVPRVNHSIGFIEDFDANAFPADWCDTDFDAGTWHGVHALVSGGGGPEGFFGGITTRPFPVLLPSGIPALAEYDVAPQRLVWTQGCVPAPERPIEKRVYQETLTALPDGAVTGDILSGTAVITTTPSHDVVLLLDFGAIHTAYPFFALDAKGGEIIELAASETLPGEWDAAGPAAGARIVPRPLLGHDAHITRYVARPGRQYFQRFEWQAVKWLQITVRNAPAGLHLTKIGIRQTHYPAHPGGQFLSSDAMLDQLWQVGRYTLQCCMHDGWEDCPSREQRQWLGDATVEQLVGQVAFGPSINPLNAKYLKDVAASQRPDGLTQMFAPGDHATNGLLIPDWTLQWILNARNHLLWSGDVDTIGAIFPQIQRALGWFEALLNPHHLVADMPYWHFMDWAGLGRSGEACALNAQLAGCFTVAAEMAAVLQQAKLAAQYATRAATIQAALNARHWDVRRQVYVDCVDPGTGQQDLRVSQHANAAMILWGSAPPERWAGMVARIADPRRLTFTAAPPIVPTGATLDPEEGVVLANTFYSHFVQAAFVKAGRADVMLALVRQRWGPMLARGATTFWESFEPTASLCHGFSATPTYQLTTGICGLMPGSDGFGRLRFAPDLAGLDHASATLETVRGTVTAALTRTADGFSGQLTLPLGMAVDAVAPPGYQLICDPNHHYRFVR